MLKVISKSLSGSLVLVALVVSGLALPAPAHEQGAKPTLYKRLGGYDAIAAVTDDFLGRLLTDSRFQAFFRGHGTDSNARTRQLIVDQLCAATGGPCIYTGRDMKTTHAGMGIAEEEWNAAVAHLVASLDRFKVPHAEKDELLALVSSLKSDIVEAKK